MLAVKKNHPSSGFTLLEMAIAIMIIGILITPLLFVYNNYQKNKKDSESYNNAQLVTDALQNYRRMTGEYPCPAGIRLPRDNPNHGRPDATACLGAAPSGLADAGDCNADGICVEKSIRALPNNRVISGAVPFRALQIDEDKTLDSAGNRLVYVITESMTDDTTLNDARGGISILNESGQPLVQPDGSAAFAIISTGPTGVGGINASGAVSQTCAGPQLDVANCNPGFETGNGVNEAIYVSAQRSEGAGAGFFDDYVMYYSQISEPNWKRTVADTETIHDLSPNFVGLGVRAPQARLHVSSGNAADTIRIEGGKLFTDRLCDQNGANCFDLIKIVGNNANALEGMKCPVGEFMVGIANGQALCADNIGIVCSDPRYPVVIGREPWGALRCAAEPKTSCAPKDATICADKDTPLPRAFADTISGPHTAGDCRQQSFICNEGDWLPHGPATGHCSYTTPTPTQVCGNDCGPGFDGTYCEMQTVACDGSIVHTSTFASDCVCDGGEFPEEDTCANIFGPGYVGVATRTRKLEAGTCIESFTDWTGCTCDVPDVDVEWVPDTTRTCTDNFIPDPANPFEKERRFNPALCAWEDTGGLRGGCICNTTPILTEEPHDCTQPGGGPTANPPGPTETYTNTVCYSPDATQPDVYRVTIDPLNCSPSPRTKITNGRCTNRAFFWSYVSTSGIGAATWPPSGGTTFIGEGCSCTEYQSTLGPATRTCFYQSDPNHIINRCDCL